MKKLLSLCTAIFLLITMLPLSAFAEETSQSEHEALIQLACEVFPEYASAIRGESVRTYAFPRAHDPMEVIYRETRTVSDTESMSISLLASGDAIVIRNNYATTTYIGSTNDIGSVGVSGTATFEVSMIDAYFKLKDVGYTIYYTGSDYFSSYGKVATSTFYSYTLISDPATSPTLIEYSLRGTPDPPDFIRFKLFFENDQLIANA